MGLGCWSFGGGFWGHQDEQDSVDALHAALDAGITHYDTARGYGHGRSEAICGRVLANRRADVFVASKHSSRDERSVMHDAVRDSLRALGFDYLDLFYIHWPRPGVDLRPSMEALMAAKDEGLIRAIGVSNFTVDHMRRALEVGPIDAHQLCYNLLWRRAEREIMPFCREHGIAVVTYSTLALGILTGKFGKEPELGPSDSRRRTVFFERDVWPRVCDSVQAMQAVADEAQRPLAHLALQWAAAQPGITSVLAGARNAEQLRQNVAAFDDPVDATVLDHLTSIADAVRPHIPDVHNIFRNKV
jgi:aryl-alcohol dehydrogenase-like predicted oxidoreductase